MGVKSVFCKRRIRFDCLLLRRLPQKLLTAVETLSNEFDVGVRPPNLSKRILIY